MDANMEVGQAQPKQCIWERKPRTCLARHSCGGHMLGGLVAWCTSWKLIGVSLLHTVKTSFRHKKSCPTIAAHHNFLVGNLL